MPRKAVNFFGEDSPLFAQPKKPAKKKVAVKKRKRKTVNLTDLFDAKKPATKKRGPKSHAQIEEEKIIKENKRIAAKAAQREKNRPKKSTKSYPKVSSPDDCKNILPAFKKKLKEQWSILEDGSLTESSMVASYINGVMAVCKEKRPKEYDELYVLRMVAKRIYSERSGN